MKYSPLKTHSDKHTSVIKLFSVCFVVVLVLVIFRNPIRSGIFGITQYLSFNTSQDNNEQVKISLLESEIAILRSENKSLRDLSKYTQNIKTVITTAAIIAKPSHSVFDQITIDRGSVHGVKTGDLVVVGDHVVLGVIKEVGENSAIINLYSKSTTTLSAFSIKDLGITVQGYGNGNGNFIFQIPVGVQVVDGDVVTLPEYPDRVVAVIKSVDSDPRNPFQKALARTPVNINEIKFVQVVRP